MLTCWTQIHRSAWTGLIRVVALFVRVFSPGFFPGPAIRYSGHIAYGDSGVCRSPGKVRCNPMFSSRLKPIGCLAARTGSELPRVATGTEVAGCTKPSESKGLPGFGGRRPYLLPPESGFSCRWVGPATATVEIRLHLDRYSVLGLHRCC